jgi:hypothetical protein
MTVSHAQQAASRDRNYLEAIETTYLKIGSAK